MPRTVYRVSVELLNVDPPESHDPELEAIAKLRAEIMGAPGLVHYPEGAEAGESWGKALRRNEAQVIEIDIDRGNPDGTGHAILEHITEYLSPPLDKMTATCSCGEEERPMPNCSALEGKDGKEHHFDGRLCIQRAPHLDRTPPRPVDPPRPSQLEGLRPPEEWERITNVKVLDPDGWMGENPKPWDEEVTAQEFSERCALSTCQRWP